MLLAARRVFNACSYNSRLMLKYRDTRALSWNLLPSSEHYLKRDNVVTIDNSIGFGTMLIGKPVIIVSTTSYNANQTVPS